MWDQVSSRLSLDSSLTVLGMKDIGFDLGEVGAVVVGYTPVFSYYDILLAGAILAQTHVLFLLEAPDTSLVTKSDLGTRINIPCKDQEILTIA